MGGDAEAVSMEITPSLTLPLWERGFFAYPYEPFDGERLISAMINPSHRCQEPSAPILAQLILNDFTASPTSMRVRS